MTNQATVPQDQLIAILAVCLFLSLPLSISGQESPSLENLTEEVTMQQQILERQITVIDSLSLRVQRAETATEFYQSALNQQVTIFSLIVLGILGLVGLVTWGGFRSEVNRLRSEFTSTLKRQTEKLDETNTRIRRAETRLALNAARSSVLMVETLFTSPSYKFIYSLRAAREYFEAVKADPDATSPAPPYRSIEANLIDALRFLNECPSTQDVLEVLSEFESEVDEALQRLTQCNSDSVRNLVGRCWSEFTNVKTRLAEADEQLSLKEDPEGEGL